MTDTKHTPEIAIADLIYCAYGTDTGILFGIPADLRGSVETIVKIAIQDYEEAAPEQQAKIDRLEAEKAELVEALRKIENTSVFLSDAMVICRTALANEPESG